MTKWAVSHIDWFDYELKTVFVIAMSFREAIIYGVIMGILKGENIEDYDDLPMEEEDIKQYFFNCDSMVNAVKMPD